MRLKSFFDKIASNDTSITDVDLVGNQLFLALPDDERNKAGLAFARNKHVKEVRMTLLRLDDNFACALAKSIETNDTIEKITLDSNLITGPGIKALISALAKNKSIQELQIRHQGKHMATKDEEELCDLLGSNKTLCRLGIDLRSSLAQAELNRKVTINSEARRKALHEQSGATHRRRAFWFKMCRKLIVYFRNNRFKLCWRRSVESQLEVRLARRHGLGLNMARHRSLV